MVCAHGRYGTRLPCPWGWGASRQAKAGSPAAAPGRRPLPPHSATEANRPEVTAALLGIVLPIIPCLIAFARYHRLRQGFKHGYKDAVFPEAVKALNPTFVYTRGAGIPAVRFRESRMFLREFDHYVAEDRVRGVHGATAFEFSEVRATYTEHGRDGAESERPVFTGLYFVADFNKHFTTRTLVVPEPREGVWSTDLLDRLGLKRGKIARLEDPEFERAFRVYAEDEIEVRYLLTPALMRRILRLRARTGPGLSLSFLRGELHVAITRFLQFGEGLAGFHEGGWTRRPSM